MRTPASVLALVALTVVTVLCGACRLCSPGIPPLGIGAGGLLAIEQDVTPFGTPIAAVTNPQGGGNWNIEVIRDGVTPAVALGYAAGPSGQQYDTWDGANAAAEDWIGYEYAMDFPFSRLVFQEGNHFVDGGYFDPPESLVVQIESVPGIWDTIEGSWDPTYTGLTTGGQVRCFETFTWKIDPPQTAMGIRIWGEPGGSADFISVGELRVFADLEGELPRAAFTATPPVGPRPLTVTLDASSSVGSGLVYEWDFGDGTDGSGVTVSHTYNELGSYRVTLTVTATISGATFQSTARGQVVAGLRVSEIGKPVALVTVPTGGGNHNIEVIRDGVQPDIAIGQNAGDSAQQYDSYDGENASAEDWIGLEFDCAFAVSKVVFQEGKHFNNGGYFDPPESLVVQYRDPDSGEWLAADGEWDPAYKGEFTDLQIVCFETFTWEIPGGVDADGIRIWGEPGGTADFISIAELEVFVDSPDLVPAASFVATPTAGTAPLAVAFDASASWGKSLDYAWDFGDGATGEGVTTSHVYEGAGVYNATLTVSTTFQGGCVVTDTATAKITTAMNLAPLGLIEARVTAPAGGGNYSLEVIRDGDRPDVEVGENMGDSLRQYDTYDGDNFADEDWIGYRFGCTYRFSQVVFQEGKHFDDGGFFDPPESLIVQIHDPKTDTWKDVPSDPSPAYQGRYTDGEIRDFETFVWSFSTPRSGDGIRIYGTPGGSAAFISVAELEVYASGITGQAPAAVAAADTIVGVAPLTVDFDGAGSTAPAGSTYSWDFGDGGSATGPTASHTYTDPDNYTATLTVSTPGGLCASDSLLVRVHPSEFTTPSGFVRRWLILGPYSQAGGSNPPAATMELDYLTDGADLTEADILPREGLAVETDYALAESTGLLSTTRADVNPGGVPTWFVWEDDDDTISFEEVFQTTPITDLMVHACVYVTNNGVDPLVCDIGCGSDDAIQVLLADASVHTNSIGRAYGNPEEIQDVVPSVTLPPGEKVRLLVKLFQGTGGVGFRLRFQATDGTPIAEPDLTFSLDPGAGPQVVFRRGDADAKGGVPNITDGIYVLNYLFLGGPAPPCLEAANADDKGGINITDGIYILNYLFQGGPAPPAPGPDTCGPEPAGSQDDVGCDLYDKC